MSNPFHESIVTALQSALETGNRRDMRFIELCKLIALTHIPNNWDVIESMITRGGDEFYIQKDTSIIQALSHVRGERIRHSG